MLIAISGTHGSGKTTVVDSLLNTLFKNGYYCEHLPSLSKTLQEKLKVIGITKFDDINSTEIRTLFQFLILGELIQSVDRVIQFHKNNPKLKMCIVADRWTADISGYGSYEDFSFIKEHNRETYYAWTNELQKVDKKIKQALKDANVELCPIFLKYHNFNKQEKASRSTAPPEAVEKHIFQYWQNNTENALVIDDPILNSRIQTIINFYQL